MRDTILGLLEGKDQNHFTNEDDYKYIYYIDLYGYPFTHIYTTSLFNTFNTPPQAGTYIYNMPSLLQSASTSKARSFVKISANYSEDGVYGVEMIPFNTVSRT